MAISNELLAELKQKLVSEKTRLESELSRIGKKVDGNEYETSFDDLGRDKEDNASEVDEYSDNVAVEDNLEKHLKDVASALERMEKGTYGICDNCGKEIEIERLQAYPEAKTCLSCN
jgi:DnaK suppressor protein